ncbi:MAG TPA: type 4a pilus biogenesis protein PilO [Vicinamibacterales bacterium]
MAFKFSLNSLPWRLQLGASAVLSVACVAAFWYFYAVPAQADIDSRKKALKKVQAEIAVGLKTAKRLPEFREDVADLEGQLEGLRTQLPEEQDVADLLRRVQGMATESKLTIRGFTPQAVTRKDLHAEWPIGIQVEGTYHDLGAFLERVSRFPRIINVGNIKVESRENQTAGATVSATCTATAFVLVNPADDKADDEADGKAAKGKAAPKAKSAKA